MRDTFLMFAWRSCVFVMILGGGFSCLALGYRAMYALLSGAVPVAATLALIALLAGVGVKWLCENRDVLVEA